MSRLVLVFAIVACASAHVSLRSQNLAKDEPEKLMKDVPGMKALEKAQAATDKQTDGKVDLNTAPGLGAINKAQSLPAQGILPSVMSFGLGGIIAIAILGVASYFVYKWHTDMKEQGVKTTFVGWKSILCCVCFPFCCTSPLTICFPIDEDKS